MERRNNKAEVTKEKISDMLVMSFERRMSG
jgi:hypothetical protein